ncbi:hypothetical protein OAO87_02235 [bacterium]|nr:hypothetical protein [bacterium]
MRSHQWTPLKKYFKASEGAAPAVNAGGALGEALAGAAAQDEDDDDDDDDEMAAAHGADGAGLAIPEGLAIPAGPMAQ